MPNVVVNNPRKGPKQFSIVLSVSDMVWLGVGAALALTIFFVFGLLVGRGYFPVEEAQVAKADQARLHAPDQDAVPTEPEVLRPEELTYPDKLSSAKTASGRTSASGGDSKPAESAATAKPEAAPAGEQAKPLETAAGPEAEVRAQTQAAGQTSGADEPRFDYVYQVAAFKESSMAQDLVDRLQAKGLAAEIKAGENKGVTWHRVRVLFTGTPPDTRELRDTVYEITKVKPVLVSKKPVE